MLSSLTARYPGVYFEIEPSRPGAELPRMDIAAFVGFAACGPLHTPVAVEGVSRFREMFGPDPTLAWDEARGEVVTAWLGPAVDAFFRNGGKRCWIVRVADESAAQTIRFEVPGLVAPSGTTTTIAARSPGSWASALQVGTVLVRERFPMAVTVDRPVRPEGAGWRVELWQSPRTLREGDLLEIVFEERRLVLFLFVETVEADEGRLVVAGTTSYWRRAPAPGSPDDGTEAPVGAENADLTPLDGSEIAEVIAATSDSPPVQPDAIHRLTFDLLSWRGARIEHRLADLSFSRAHPRFWDDLPSDERLFEPNTGRPQRKLIPEERLFLDEATTPRFPFASSGTGTDHYLPLGMATVPDASEAGAADVPSLTTLEIDGLAAFDDRLFLDGDLTRTYTDGLYGEAEHKHSLRIFGANGEPLRGLHSLFPIAEVSSIAVPDALQRGWTRLPPEMREPLEAPRLDPVPQLDAFGRARLSWTTVSRATGYRLQVAQCRNFSRPTVIPAEDAETEAYFVPTDACPARYYFRVRSERRGETSAWSNARAAELPPRSFDDCGALPPGIADLVLAATPSGSPDLGPELSWDYETGETAELDDTYELQKSSEPGFESPERIPADAEGFDPVTRRYLPGPFDDTARYFRVRVVRRRQKGVWSNTVVLAPSGRSAWTLVPEAEYDSATLLSVQRALIRLCAARGDAVALLSLPREYRPADADAHLGDLLPQVRWRSGSSERAVVGTLNVPALTHGEERSLTYAAMYHPWAAVAEAEAEQARRGVLRVRWMPPDGVVAGRIALRTLRSGAWIAPANDPLAGVIALDPPMDRSASMALINIQINPLIRDPRGFLVFNAETLSRQEDLRPLSVRRLMILLRRLALREGATFVFEPHDDDFRGLVRQRFDRALSNMYVRGAFAGTSPAAAFRVVVDESVNPPHATETGRFFVELRVSPSRPFHYLIVRLQQTSPERVVAEEE